MLKLPFKQTTTLISYLVDMQTCTHLIGQLTKIINYIFLNLISNVSMISLK